MDQKLINAKINTLIQQRNDALNQVVNVTGELVVMAERVKELEAELNAAKNEESADA